MVSSSRYLWHNGHSLQSASKFHLPSRPIVGVTNEFLWPEIAYDAEKVPFFLVCIQAHEQKNPDTDIKSCLFVVWYY